MELAVAGGNAIKVSEATFGRDFSEALVHQVVTAYLAGGRAGTKAQKNRSAVSGGGKSPGARKVRAGPVPVPSAARSGAVVADFCGTPQDHSQKVNRKMYRGALQAILSELVRQDRLVVLDSLELQSTEDQELLSKLAELGFRERPDRDH